MEANSRGQDPQPVLVAGETWYCSTGGNALVHKERVKKMIPDCICDISIILSADSQEQNVYHYLKRKRKKNIRYEKPMMIEFF